MSVSVSSFASFRSDALGVLVLSCVALLLVLGGWVRAARPQRHEQLQRYCATEGGVWVRTCDGEDVQARQPLCWWTADVEELAALGGIGERRARRLLKMRDHGLAPSDEALRAQRGVGPRTIERLEAEVTVHCAWWTEESGAW